MGLADPKRQGKGRDSSKLRGAAPKPEYHGSKVSVIKTPLYLTEKQELVFDPSDPFDQGALEYFAGREAAGDASIEDIKGNKIVTITHVKNLNLADILNMPMPEGNSEKFLEEKDFSKYLPGPVVGIMPIGRYTRDMFSHADFKDENQEEALQGLVKDIGDHPYHLEAFSEAARMQGERALQPEDIARYSVADFAKFLKEHPKSFGKVHAEYFFDKYAKSIVPSDKYMTQTLRSKIYDMDHTAEMDISRVKRQDDGTWNAMAWLLALGNGLDLIEDSSTHGLTIFRYGKNIDEMVHEQERERQYSASESHFRGKNNGTKPFKNCLTQYDGCVGIDLTKDKDTEEERCEATHVRLLDLNPENRQYAIISMGSISPVTGRHSVNMTISQEKLGEQ